MERTFACLTEQDWGYLEDSMADEYAGQGAALEPKMKEHVPSAAII